MRALREMKFFLRAAMLVAAALTIASCANFMHGKDEDINVTSNPPGADVTLSNGMTGVTPFTITVPRERDLVFHFSKSGYQPTDINNISQVESRYIAADWASMLLTAIPFAWISDVSSGAAHTHQLTTINADLVADPGMVVHPPPPTPTPLATPTPQATPSVEPEGQAD
jgi:predicted small secreted protein